MKKYRNLTVSMNSKCISKLTSYVKDVHALLDYFYEFVMAEQSVVFLT